MAPISCFTPVPGHTKSGYMKSFLESSVSRTNERNASLRRRRRGRLIGNDMLRFYHPVAAGGRRQNRDEVRRGGREGVVHPGRCGGQERPWRPDVARG